jgi:hypothetical protein
VVESKGTGHLADWENHAVYRYGGPAGLSWAAVPDRTLVRSEIRCSSPRQMLSLELQ